MSDGEDPAAARTREGQECLWVIDGAIARGKVLSVKSADFVNATRERFEKYGERTLISPRELEWLRDLRKRCE